MHKRLTTFWLMLGLLLTIVGGRSVMAQSGSAAITAVNIVATSATNANLSFSYSTSLDPTTIRYQVSYGPNVAYGTDTVATGFDQAALTTHNQAVTLLGLTAGTSYHFTIKLYSATNELLVSSADRTFTTASTGGNSSQLIIDRIRVDCVNISCNIYFATSKTATVEARWDASSQNAFTSYTTGTSEGSPSDTFRSLHIPPANQAQLTPNTQYHYRLQAVGTVPNESFTTGDLAFTTSASASDHVFATGQCSDGGTPPTTVDIGSCLGSLFCSAAGTLVSDCTKCGFLCESKKTCRTGSPNAFCDPDRSLTGAPTQCNNSSCYDARGNFISPAPAACVSTWPRCNANTILKVRNDRGCNLWLSCATSLQTDGSASGPGENLCLSLGACNSLNSNGQCNNYLPLGQCNNDPLRFCNNDTDCQAGGTCNNPDPNVPTKALQNVTYQSPQDIEKLADLSGNIIAGLDWSDQGGSNVIQGNLPWQLMRQIGGDAQVTNGDMEFRAPEVAPWNPVPEGATPADSLRVDFEDKDNSSNHVLTVEPVTQTTVALRCSNNATKSCTVATQATDCATPAPAGTCGNQNIPVQFSGAATNSFTASPSEYYYAEARIRAVGGNPVVRVQFGHGGYKEFSVSTTIGSTTTTTNSYVKVSTTAAWQRVTLGPLKGMSGTTKLAFVCDDAASCGKFQVDDVVVKPILQINTNPSYIAPTCRLYPKNDAPSCDYASTNGILYKGWKGYCLEHDSQTGTCLSWWPVDIIKGESSIFGSEKAAGYQDRTPLYLCAEAAGLNGLNQFNANMSYTVGINYRSYIAFSPNSGNCSSARATDFTLATCTRDEAGNLNDTPPQDYMVRVTATQADASLSMDQISSVRWQSVGTFASLNPTFVVYNNSALQSSTSFSSPAESGNSGMHDWAIWQKVNPAANETSWIYSNATPCARVPLNEGGQNCIYGAVVFDSTTRLLKRYELIENDRTDGVDGTGVAEPATYQVVFSVKESCNTLVEVVDQNGTSSAFASRVGSAVYKVPDLNYGLSTDLSPFGGALPPQSNPTDPNAWPLLSSEQPNYTTIPAPGQARAGSPYACKGNCADVVCTVGNTSCLTNGAIDTSKVRTCQQADADQDGTPDGECVGVVAAAASSKGTQVFSSTLSTGDSYFAQERIKRLFAQSFGVWSNLRCSNNVSKACLVSSDCGGGTCNVRRGSYLQIDNSSPDSTGTFVGWKPPTQICPANPAYRANVCTSTRQQCSAALVVNGVSGPGSIATPENDAALKQTGMIAALTSCGLDKVGTDPLPTSPGTPITGTPNNSGAGKVACNGDSVECPGGGTTGYEKGTAAKFTTFTLSAPCSYNSTTGYTCSGRCSSTASYVNAAKPTVTAQSKYLRPSYVAGSQADYCAIPPEVSNAMFTVGTATTATISGGSGSIGIKFNTSADQEQVPLNSIRIDWGDNQDEFAFPYAPRNDTTKPHIFSHTYVTNRGDVNHCKTVNGRTTCQFPIKIQVEDSWNWCNDGDATTTCHNNTLSNGKKDSSKWFDTGLKVIVQP